MALLLLLILVSCNQSKPVNETVEQSVPLTASLPVAQTASFETGAVIPSIVLQSNSSETFALYLPKGYSDSAKLPVIIFFDPHGDGALPLNLYKELADEFHFILVGSNSSKNGMNMQQAKQVADNLVAEVKTRFSINKKSITLCGFSGGAKVALISAAENSSVSSVIYCGAVAQLTPTHPLLFLGFAGTRDMNYTDVVSFGWDLMSNSAKYMIEWNGKHEFPDAKTFKDAFVFLTTGSVPDYEKKKATITVKELVEEQNYKIRLQQAFQTQDLYWWKQEIASLNSKKKTSPMYERLLGFVSLACYSYSNQTLQQNNLQAAEKILSIYQLADPGNKDCETFIVELQKRKTGTHQ